MGKIAYKVIVNILNFLTISEIFGVCILLNLAWRRVISSDNFLQCLVQRTLGLNFPPQDSADQCYQILKSHCNVEFVSYPATINIEVRMPIEGTMEFFDHFKESYEGCGEGKRINFDPDNGADPSGSTLCSESSKQQEAFRFQYKLFLMQTISYSAKPLNLTFQLSLTLDSIEPKYSSSKTTMGNTSLNSCISTMSTHVVNPLNENAAKMCINTQPIASANYNTAKCSRESNVEDQLKSMLLSSRSLLQEAK